MTRQRRHPYPCPSCGRTVEATAAYMARQRRPCRPCIRIANGWACRDCGTADPEHPSPCPSLTDTAPTTEQEHRP